MTDNIITEIERIIKENAEMKAKLTRYEINQRNSLLRERLYQSELATLKNQLQKIYESIKLTPHSQDEEYNKIVYSNEVEE